MVKITFLGTAAQIPTFKRNHSGILLNYNEENILIDCGEGTQRQFRTARINPGKVTKLLITHWHGDHVLGIPGFLQSLSLSEYGKILWVYGPKGIKEHFRKLLDAFPFDRSYEIRVEEVNGKFFENDNFYLEAKEMQHGIPTNAYCFVLKDKIRIDKKKLVKSGLKDIKSIKKLKEGKNAKFEGKNFLAKDMTYLDKGKKVSIVLDTKLNNKIIPFVRGSDLLICEASFDSELEDKAREHLHLTAGQAGKIANESNSKKLYLTHISQRYENKKDVLIKDAKKNFKESFIAKDLESVEVLK